MSRGEMTLIGAIVTIFLLSLGLTIAFPSPTIRVCDRYETRMVSEYNVALKMVLPTRRTRCVAIHEEPNPRYHPRETK